MILLTAAIVALSLLIFYHFQKEWKLPRRLPPGPIRFPLIGNFGQILANRQRSVPFVMFQNMCRKYGPVMFFQLGSKYQVIIDDCETIRELLCSDIWIERFYDDWIAERAYGKKLGVLLISGPVWKEMRRFSLRTLRDFGFGKQKSMDATIQEELAELMSELNQQIAKSGDKKEAVVTMHQFFTISILNILWNMIAGFRFSHSDAKLKQLLVLIDQVIKENSIGGARSAALRIPILRFLITRLTKEGRRRNEMISATHAFFREFFDERRAQGTYREDQSDFIDVFLHEIDAHAHLGSDDNVNYYTDDQFVVLVKDLFLAGSETTSNSMEFAILYMALHPVVQWKVQAEIDSVVGFSRFPSAADDKPKLPYTEATLLEIQRMANVVPIIVRSPTTATTIGEYTVPEGTIGIINLYSMHMNETNFPRPSEFKPERFYDETTNSVVNSHKIMPFGIGKRICLGEVLAKTTLFTYFATFLQQYNFELIARTSNGSDEVKREELMEPVVGFTLSPKNYSVKITQRLP